MTHPKGVVYPGLWKQLPDIRWRVFWQPLLPGLFLFSTSYLPIRGQRGSQEPMSGPLSAWTVLYKGYSLSYLPMGTGNCVSGTKRIHRCWNQLVWKLAWQIARVGNDTPADQ